MEGNATPAEIDMIWVSFHNTLFTQLVTQLVAQLVTKLFVKLTSSGNLEWKASI